MLKKTALAMPAVLSKELSSDTPTARMSDSQQNHNKR
jgi:hypothetical protein